MATAAFGSVHQWWNYSKSNFPGKKKRLGGLFHVRRRSEIVAWRKALEKLYQEIWRNGLIDYLTIREKEDCLVVTFDKASHQVSSKSEDWKYLSCATMEKLNFMQKNTKTARQEIRRGDQCHFSLLNNKKVLPSRVFPIKAFHRVSSEIKDSIPWICAVMKNRYMQKGAGNANHKNMQRWSKLFFVFEEGKRTVPSRILCVGSYRGSSTSKDSNPLTCTVMKNSSMQKALETLIKKLGDDRNNSSLSKIKRRTVSSRISCEPSHWMSSTVIEYNRKRNGTSWSRSSVW